MFYEKNGNYEMVMELSHFYEWSYVVFAHIIFYDDMDVDVYLGMSYTDNCPICGHPLDKVYYGGGTHKWECEPCGKHFVTEITNERE